jgi:hypothetical protein
MPSNFHLRSSENGISAAIALRQLTDFVAGFEPSADLIQQRSFEIHQAVLSDSPYIREGNFETIHSRDLALLFRVYDQQCFAGLLHRALDGTSLNFHLSTRMTSAGGKTTRRRWPDGKVSFEISIACSLLFSGFRQADRTVTACGIVCTDRLQAMQRIFEHELIHLVEQLCWTDSNCSSARFQNIARRHFLHESHTHELVTWRERAVQSGIVPGTEVSFVFEGRTLSGRVNRITKRATVLVEDQAGRLFSDGRRYTTYYIPIDWLSIAQQENK